MPRPTLCSLEAPSSIIAALGLLFYGASLIIRRNGFCSCTKTGCIGLHQKEDKGNVDRLGSTWNRLRRGVQREHPTRHKTYPPLGKPRAKTGEARAPGGMNPPQA